MPTSACAVRRSRSAAASSCPRSSASWPRTAGAARRGLRSMSLRSTAAASRRWPAVLTNPGFVAANLDRAAGGACCAGSPSPAGCAVATAARCCVALPAADQRIAALRSVAPLPLADARQTLTLLALAVWHGIRPERKRVADRCRRPLLTSRHTTPQHTACIPISTAPTRPLPGSPAHYCLLGSDAGTRATLGALWALEANSPASCPKCREPAVARAKFDWWRAELRTLEGGTPQHPVTQALAPFASRAARRRPPARMLWKAMRWCRLRRLAEPRRARAARADPDWRHAGTALRSSCSGRRAAGRRLARTNSGPAHAQFERLREVRADALRGHCTVPDDELAAHGLTHAGSAEAADERRHAGAVRRADRPHPRHAGPRAGTPVAGRAPGALTPLVVRAALEAATSPRSRPTVWRCSNGASS